MAGGAHQDDDDLPDFSDAEESADATIATEAPQFDLPSNIPLPISSPPPPLDLPPPAPVPVDARPASKPLIVVDPPKPASARVPAVPSPGAASTVPDPKKPSPVTPPGESRNELPTRLAKVPPHELLAQSGKRDALRSSPTSPLASTAFGGDTANDAETKALSLPAEYRKGSPDTSGLGESEPEDEATRAVGKRMLRPLQDAQVVVGHDAVGDEATVAVVAGANAAANLANSPIAAALRETLGQPAEPTFPPPPAPRPGVAGAVGVPAPRPPQATALGLGAVSAPPPWTAQQQQQPMQPPPPSMGGQRVSDPGFPSMSQPYPESGPRMPLAHPSAGHYPPQHPSAPQQPVQPMPMGPQGAMMRPGHPGQGRGPIHWQPGPPEPKVGFLERLFGRPVSSQAILLFAVGTVCLAIFILGIVLYAKTKM